MYVHKKNQCVLCSLLPEPSTVVVLVLAVGINARSNNTREHVFFLSLDNMFPSLSSPLSSNYHTCCLLDLHTKKICIILFMLLLTSRENDLIELVLFAVVCHACTDPYALSQGQRYQGARESACDWINISYG